MNVLQHSGKVSASAGQRAFRSGPAPRPSARPAACRATGSGALILATTCATCTIMLRQKDFMASIRPRGGSVSWTSSSCASPCHFCFRIRTVLGRGVQRQSQGCTGREAAACSGCSCPCCPCHRGGGRAGEGGAGPGRTACNCSVDSVVTFGETSNCTSKLQAAATPAARAVHLPRGVLVKRPWGTDDAPNLSRHSALPTQARTCAVWAMLVARCFAAHPH